MKTTSKIIIMLLGVIVVCSLLLPVVMFKSEGNTERKNMMKLTGEQVTVQFDSIEKLIIDMHPGVEGRRVNGNDVDYDCKLDFEIEEDPAVTGIEIIMDKVWADNVTLSCDNDSTLMLYVDLHTIISGGIDDDTPYYDKVFHILSGQEKVATIKVAPGGKTKIVEMLTKSYNLSLDKISYPLVIKSSKSYSLFLSECNIPKLTLGADKAGISMGDKSIIDILEVDNANVTFSVFEDDSRVNLLDYYQSGDQQGAIVDAIDEDEEVRIHNVNYHYYDNDMLNAKIKLQPGTKFTMICHKAD